MILTTTAQALIVQLTTPPPLVMAILTPWAERVRDMLLPCVGEKSITESDWCRVTAALGHLAWAADDAIPAMGDPARSVEQAVFGLLQEIRP